MSRKIYAIGAVLLVLAVVAPPVAAQGSVTGRIEGTVKDSGGTPVPGVTVTAYSDALVRRKTSTVTDGSGVYRFPALPSGKYAVEATLSGFQTSRKDGVRITLGQAIAIDLVMELSKVTAGVTVTADTPIVSVVSNSVSTSFGKEYLDKQAVPRNYYQVITTAPGVNLDTTGSSGSAILAYGGTEERQNAFTLDGVNVGDSGGGGHWLLPSIQWMEEIQVTGLGANAEFGGYTGGIINGVTKSGGNEFHGALEAYYEPASWVSNNDPTGVQATTKFEDYALSVGGPIVKDKIWFFGSAEYWHQITTPVGAADTSDRSIPRFLGKVTFQPNDTNRIFVMGEYDAVTNERRGISALTLPSGTQKQDGPGVTFAVNWESTLNSSNFVNVKITGNDGNDNYYPYSGTSVPGHIDYYSGGPEYTWYNAPFQNLSHRHSLTGEGSWSLFSDGLFGKNDSHSFKFGALYETATTMDSWRRNGGYTYYDDSSACTSLSAYFQNPDCGRYERSKGYGEYELHGQQQGYTFYAQDSVRLDRVTINGGLRFTAYRAGFQPGYGDSTVYSVNFVDPRIGFVWDLSGDARWAVKAHWGRYHSSMYTYLYDRQISGHASIMSQDSEWDPDTQTWGPWSTNVPEAAPMGKVSHPYVDETLLTLEHQLGKDMALGFDFIDRRFANIMGLVNTNNDYSAVSVSNPLTGGTLNFWNLNTDPSFVLTTDNPGYRTYDSLVLRFDKRYANGWQLRSSLVWTDLKGNVLKNDGYADELKDRNGLVNADGKMDLSANEWEFKLSGSASLPFGFMASGQYTYLSGQYWTPYADVRSFLDGNYTTGRYVNMEGRGSEKLPARNLIDLRLAWGTNLAKALRLELSLECFNLLNSSTALAVDSYYGRVRGSGWTKNSNYGVATSIERPREIRAGARLTF